MPCRCDSYSGPSASELAGKDSQIRDLEQRLCQAQSLVYKLIVVIDAQHKTLERYVPCVDPISDLRPLATKLVTELVAHKRAEHQSDIAEKRRLLDASKRSRDLASSRKNEAERERQQHDDRAAKLAVEIIAMENAKDKDLLGG